MLDPTSNTALEIGLSSKIWASSTRLSGKLQMCLTRFTFPVKNFSSGTFSFLPVNFNTQAFLKISASFLVDKVVTSLTLYTKASCEPLNQG